jgi:P22_AR N-terminal domain
MSEEQAIVPHREQTVTFYGDDIPVAQTEDGELFVPLRPLTQFLGLARQGQQERVLRDPVMAARVRPVMMKSTDGKRYSTLCLPLDLLPGWLFGISTSRVKPELQDKLNRYRAECFRVLWSAFKADIVATSQPRPTGLTRAEETFALIDAMRDMALQQIEFERSLTQLDAAQKETERKREIMASWMRDFVQTTRSKLGEFEGRIAGLEIRVDPRNSVTEAEAAEIALAVKNVAYELEKRAGTSSYGRVYSELYRRFDVRSYRVIARDKYQAVLDWLRNWYNGLINGEGEGE